MALIERFEPVNLERSKIHDPIGAQFASFSEGARKIVQIDTCGRTTRAIPGKKSQTIQLDEQGAKALVEILRREFDF